MEEQHLIIYIHINNIHVFTVTFDQCNVSFLNRVIKLLKRKKKYWPEAFEQFSISFNYHWQVG